MSKRIKVAATNQISPGQQKMVRAGQEEIALFNISGTFYAISNVCPHSTGPLAEGRLYGTIVTCPWHGAQFEVTTGQLCGGPATKNVATYPVYVEDGSIYIEVA